jgi:hydrogenase maturation protease
MKTLIAGFDNIFLSDDGFGPAVIRALDASAFPEGVRVRDFGTGGMHLALEMLDGYERIVIVDAIGREDPAGTIFAIDVSEHCHPEHSNDCHPEHVEGRPSEVEAIDGHAMNAEAVLALYRQLHLQSGSEEEPQIIVVGCVPQSIEQGMELSAPVAAAIPACIDVIRRLTLQAAATGAQS